MMDAATTRLLDQRLGRAQRDGRVPSLVAGVVLDGELAWSGGAGHRNGRPDGPVPDANTAYRIGSITKVMTAVLVLQLRARGRLDLDDRVDVHLDELRNAPVGGLRLAELLAHASGLRAEPGSPWWERSSGRTWGELQPDLRGPDVRPAPRGTFHYSNLGYALLGRIVAGHASAPWEEVLAARLLEPLGMTRTASSPAEPVARPLAVHPHRDVVLEEPTRDTLAMAPAGQSWSTVADLARLARFLLDGHDDVLDAEVLAEMARPRVVGTLDPPVAHGLGLQVVSRGGRTLVGHGGSIPGFVATTFVDRDDRSGFVVLGNSTTGFDPSLGVDLLSIAREACPPAVDSWVPRTAAAPQLDELVGLWFWGPRPIMIREGDDGQLEVDLGQASRDTTLHHVGGDRWIGRGGYWDGEPATVGRAEDGTISHLDLASFALTRQPYEPPGPVPGGAGEGWGPNR